MNSPVSDYRKQMRKKARWCLYLTITEQSANDSYINMVFGVLTRTSYSSISICAQLQNMWEAGLIYLSLHFYQLSPENTGAQTAPSWMTCPLPKTWQGPRLNITAMFEQERLSPSPRFHPSASLLCQLKALMSFTG